MISRMIVVAVFLLTGSAMAADWPMLGGNPRRTGWSTDEMPAPVKRKWYRMFPREGLACGVQPVIANGVVYIGTMHGTMYAIDAETGKDVWKTPVGGPILHSAAVVDGRCYFGSMDGKVYALDARTGGKVWEYQTGLGIWNAPVVADGVVFIGSRDGFFYALDAEEGQRLWRTEVGGPILCSPAYENNRVYFAAEDMKAYCLAADTGEVLWTGQLHGVSARAYHPVIAGDIVVFTTQPGLGKFGPIDVLLEACREIGLQPRQRIGADPRGPEEPKEVVEAKYKHDEALLNDPRTLVKQMAGVRRIQKERPGTRTFFAFDKNSGVEPWIAPVCWQEGSGGMGNPPIVSPDGEMYVKYGIYTWSKHGEYFPYTRIGKVDLKTGDISMVRDPMIYGYPIGMTHDEMARFTGSGRSIVHAREGFPGFRGIVAINLDDLKLRTLGDNIHFGDSAIGPMNILRLLKDETIPPGMEYITRGSGVFGGTGTYAAVSIADDTLYYVPGHEGRVSCSLIAWQTNPGGEEPQWQDPNDKKWHDTSFLGSANVALLREQPFDWDMLARPYGRCWPRGDERIEPESAESFKERQTAAKTHAAGLSDEELSNYIWNVDTPEPSRATVWLKSELAEKVRELISTDWAPMRYPDMMFGGWYYFDDPTDVFATLATAWPALDEQLQGQVRQYLRRQFASTDPLGTNLLTPDKGERRTAYVLPEYADLSSRDLRPIGIGRLYPLWAWANATGDWGLLEAKWRGTIRPMGQTVAVAADPATTLYDNQTLSGLIAYCRLARRFGDAAAVAAAEKVTIALLRNRVEAEWTYAYTNFVRREGHPRMPAMPGRYMFLTPEIGRLVRDHAADLNTALYERYINHLRPLWYMAWGPMMYYAWETSLDHPVNPWATFGARAMLFGDDGMTLQGYLDRPWCKADPYYIQKLAWTCRARWPKE